MLVSYAKYIIPIVVFIGVLIVVLRTVGILVHKLVILLAEIAFISFMLWKCQEYLWGSIVGGVVGMVILLAIYRYLHHVNFKSRIDPPPIYFLGRPKV